MAGMGDKILQSEGQSRAARQEGSYPDVVFIYFQVSPGISCGPAPLPCSGAVAGANSGISKEGVLIKHASNLGCGGGWHTLWGLADTGGGWHMLWGALGWEHAAAGTGWSLCLQG